MKNKKVITVNSQVFIAIGGMSKPENLICVKSTAYSEVYYQQAPTFYLQRWSINIAGWVT